MIPACPLYLFIEQVAVPCERFLAGHAVFSPLRAGRVHEAVSVFLGCGPVAGLLHKGLKEGIRDGKLADIKFLKANCYFGKLIFCEVIARQ